MTRVTVGSFEQVSLPEWNNMTVAAKVDTGAFSGALHCAKISLSNDGKKLTFCPTSQTDFAIETTDFITQTVRVASGQEHIRYLVPLKVELQGETYSTIMGLADRSSMQYEMLIGRRFLRENNMLVDVTINGEHDEEWKRVNE